MKKTYLIPAMQGQQRSHKGRHILEHLERGIILCPDSR